MKPPATVAVTGLTGTVGQGLLPFLDADRRVERVIGIGSRPWDPVGHPKVDYRQVDVRDRAGLREALEGADAVVHLAFSLYGIRQRNASLEAINVEGSANVLEAAADAGARRFVYTSSGAVYGFDSKRPARVDEEAPVAPEPRHFYSKHKGAAEEALLTRLARLRDMEWIFLRPCAVVGPHAAGAAAHLLPSSLATLGEAVLRAYAGLRPAVPGPPVPLQFVHERDVGQAIHRALTTSRTRTVYNLGGDGMVDPADVPRVLGLRTLPVPNPVSRAAVEVAAKLPYVSPALGWLQLATHPLELDSSRAKRELRWKPEYTSREALASTREGLGF